MAKYQRAFRTHKGNIRQQNEDACAFFDIAEDTLAAVVCDGMGGHIGGKMASKIAIESFETNFNSDKYDWIPELIPDLLDQAFAEAHSAIAYTSTKNTLLSGMGTTCVVLLLQGDNVYCAHVGDSRLYLLRNNHLIQLTKDHSFVQKLIDEGVITEAEADYHPQRNFIERALGSDNPQPDIARLNQTIEKPKVGDIFLLCSDGLYNEISAIEIKNVLEESTLSLEGKVIRLLEQSLQNGGGDNITIQLIECIG